MLSIKQHQTTPLQTLSNCNVKLLEHDDHLDFVSHITRVCPSGVAWHLAGALIGAATLLCKAQKQIHTTAISCLSTQVNMP